MRRGYLLVYQSWGIRLRGKQGKVRRTLRFSYLWLCKELTGDGGRKGELHRAVRRTAAVREGEMWQVQKRQRAELANKALEDEKRPLKKLSNPLQVDTAFFPLHLTLFQVAFGRSHLSVLFLGFGLECSVQRLASAFPSPSGHATVLAPVDLHSQAFSVPDTTPSSNTQSAGARISPCLVRCEGSSWLPRTHHKTHRRNPSAKLPGQADKKGDKSEKQQGEHEG